MTYNSWDYMKLSEAIDINPRTPLKKGTIAKKISMQDLEEFNKKIRSYELSEFKSGGSKFQNGDTLLARITPSLENGKTAFVDILEDGEIGFGSTEFLVLRAKQGITDEEFIYYLSISPKFREIAIKSMTGTTGRQRVQADVLKNSFFKFPPLWEQKQIAKILSVLDEKIELNNQINLTIEEIAKTIFKHWFVDFEFPNENGEPYKSSGGKFKESEIGMIPVNWKLRSLDEIANYQNGLAMQKYRPENDEKSLPVVKIKELNKGFTDETSDRCRNDIDEKVIINDGDVIFSWSGTLLVKIWLGGKAGLNQHLFKVTSKKYPKWFYYYWTKHHLPEFIRIAEDKTTTMGHIKRTHLKEAKVVLPDDSLLNKFTLTFEPLVEKIIQLGIENRTLIYLRDSLLPKLMSGEIRIPEAEQEVEACLQKNS